MKKLIAVVGMSGSGKSVATTYLEDQGYKKIYFGGVIYDKMKEAGIEITPDSQKEFRENLRKEQREAVKMQNYEKAAELRDRIRELEKGGEN